MRETLPLGGHHMYDRLVARPLARFYSRLAGQLPPGRVLDVGCGPGHLAAAIDRPDTVAVDLDPVQVRIAKANHPDLDVRQGDAAELPLADEAFDVVVTSESFHHWSDRPAGIREARRVLRPGGTLVIIEGCGDVRKDEVAAFFGRWPWPGLTLLTRAVFRVHGFTPTALENDVLPLLANVFDDVAVERVDGWWRVTAS